MKHSLILFLLLFFLNISVKADEFEQLMGKSTPHWRYVEQAQDLQTLEFVKTLYEKNKEVQFTDQGVYKIPKVVHFIWLGPKPFPPYSVENIRTWMAHHPDWTFKFWTDRDREAPCSGMQVIDVSTFHFLKLGSCYASSQNFGEKSDLLRYEILFQEGGVYADHDANSLQRFDGLHRGYDFYCCLEAPHEPFVDLNITCGNGVLGSRPGHPCVAKVIDLIAENWQPMAEKYRGRDPYSQTEIVMQRTYIALTRALRESIDLPGNTDIVFPASYFFSKGGMPSLYSKHFYATAWDDSKIQPSVAKMVQEKLLHKVDKKSVRLQWVLVAFLSLNLMGLGFCIKRVKVRGF